MEVVKYALTIYSWTVIGVLIAFLWRIAYFYEKTSGQRVRYYLLNLPSLLLATAVIWYLVRDVEFTGEPAGDLFLFSGGLLLWMFGFRLQELMTGERQ